MLPLQLQSRLELRVGVRSFFHDDGFVVWRTFLAYHVHGRPVVGTRLFLRVVVLDSVFFRVLLLLLLYIIRSLLLFPVLLKISLSEAY